MKSRWKRMYQMGATFLCPYCLKQRPLDEATAEHEPPRSRQEEFGKSNIIVVCKECNNEKGALTLEEYKEWKRLDAIRNGVKKR